LKDVRDFVIGMVTSSRAYQRMFAPFSQSQSKTLAGIMFEQLNLDVARGVVTSPEEYIQRLDALPDETGKRINYTELANFTEGLHETSAAMLGLTPLVLEVGSAAVEDTDPVLSYHLSHAGSTLDGTLDIKEGFSQGYAFLQGNDWLNQMLHSPLGKPLVAVQGIVGGIDYTVGAYRLVADPTIRPGASEYAWTERVGVAAQAIGGAFLVGGAVSAFVPGAQPVAAVLLTAGVVFEGAGAIMQNWDWIAETTQKISHRFGGKP